jgi:hypothetical protein
VALWRRVFALKEEEYEETAEILQECLAANSNKNNSVLKNYGNLSHGDAPITSPFAVEARQDFLRSIALRNNNNKSLPPAQAQRAAITTSQQRHGRGGGGESLLPLSSLTRQERNAIHERSIHEPNLHVDAMYLPQ